MSASDRAAAGAQVDTFLLKKHKNLLELQRIKIGHDNSGAGPGAFPPVSAIFFCVREAARPEHARRTETHAAAASLGPDDGGTCSFVSDRPQPQP